MLALLAILAAVPAPPRPTPAPIATADTPAEGRRLRLKSEKSFLRIGSMKGTIREKAIQHGSAESADDPASETESDFLYKRISGMENVRFETVVPVPLSVIFDG